MGNTKVAKLETYEGVPTLCTKKRQVARALELVVQFLGLENGSLKIFVHQGKPSERVEIQTSISKDI